MNLGPSCSNKIGTLIQEKVSTIVTKPVWQERIRAVESEYGRPAEVLNAVSCHQLSGPVVLIVWIA